MDELTKLLHAVQSAIKAAREHADALEQVAATLQAFSARVQLTTTLSDDDVPGLDDPGDALDPPMSEDEIRALLSRAAGQLGADKVRTVILEECGSQKKAADMTVRERNCVRISLELLGVKRSA